MKSKESQVKYFKKVNKDEIINIEESEIKQISSIIISSEVENIEIIKTTSKLRVLTKTTLRIIYSKNKDNSLYVVEKDVIDTNYIDTPEELAINDINLAIIKNKIKVEVYTENLSSKIIENKLLLINFYMIINLKINPVISLGFIINNNIFDNVFSSYYDGKNLTQLTFTSDTRYESIMWQKNGSNLVFIGYKGNETYINVVQVGSKNIVNCVNVNNYVNNFCFYNSNEIILSIKEDNTDLLYLYSLKQNKIKEFKNLDTKISKNFTKPYYSSSLGLIFCLCKINSINCLCTINKTKNISVLFNLEEVQDYIINEIANKAIIKVNKNGDFYFYIISLESQNIDFIDFDFEYHEIIKIKYCSNKYLNETLYILYRYENKYYICLYDIYKSTSYIIYKDNKILDFDINYKNLDIFVVTSNNIFSQVIKINKNENKEIIKVPSTIKSIFIK